MKLPSLLTRLVAKFCNWSKYSYFDLDGYMLRHYCLVLPWFAVRKHTILRSDNDRHLHDHPFSSISIILAGSYIEHQVDWNGPPDRSYAMVINNKMTQVYVYLRTPGSVIIRRADSLHKLELCQGGPVTTCFITGKKAKEWGFASEQGWIHNVEYLGSQGK